MLARPTGRGGPAPLAIEYRLIGDLIPYARNARTHSEEQVALIAGSIRESGFTKPILVDDEDLLGQFLAEETVVDPGALIYTADLHQRFRQWVELHGLASWTSHTFTKELKSQGLQECRRSNGRAFIGLQLARQ
jgi:Poxvirus D5 protein-like